jgi:hypothetical protein
MNLPHGPQYGIEGEEKFYWQEPVAQLVVQKPFNPFGLPSNPKQIPLRATIKVYFALCSTPGNTPEGTFFAHSSTPEAIFSLKFR